MANLESVRVVAADSDLARAVGVPAAYDYGPERISWLGNLVTDWMGDDAFLKRLNVQVRRHNIIGDLTTCEGTVAKVWHEGGENLVELSVRGLTTTVRKPRWVWRSSPCHLARSPFRITEHQPPLAASRRPTLIVPFGCSSSARQILAWMIHAKLAAAREADECVALRLSVW